MRSPVDNVLRRAELFSLDYSGRFNLVRNEAIARIKLTKGCCFFFASTQPTGDAIALWNGRTRSRFMNQTVLRNSY